MTTFALTVVVDLTVAIQVGMVLAAFLFMRRMAEVTNVSMVTRELSDRADDELTDPNAMRRRVVPKGVDVYEINGPFFFGAAEQFKGTTRTHLGMEPVAPPTTAIPTVNAGDTGRRSGIYQNDSV